MAIGKFQGVISPTTPKGSRVTSTSTEGRTEATFSPARRKVSPEKNRKICPARRLSPTLSARELADDVARVRGIDVRSGVARRDPLARDEVLSLEGHGPSRVPFRAS